jgi:hypothetical protein
VLEPALQVRLLVLGPGRRASFAQGGVDLAGKPCQRLIFSGRDDTHILPRSGCVTGRAGQGG